MVKGDRRVGEGQREDRRVGGGQREDRRVGGWGRETGEWEEGREKT